MTHYWTQAEMDSLSEFNRVSRYDGPIRRKPKTSIRVLAQRTLREVKRTFAAYIDKDNGPVLMKDWGTVSGCEAPYAVVWEGGPYEWAVLASMGGVDEEMTTLVQEASEYFAGKPAKPVTVEAVEVEGAFLEPYTSYALGVYRA